MFVCSAGEVQRLPSLIVEKGTDKGLTAEIKAGQTLIIGRDSECELHLSDTLASRHHCRVESRGGKFYVVDGGSRNGTFLNGRRISDAELTPGDQILLGETLIAFQAEPAAVEPLIGREIGGYRILQLLGKGGMGRVYKAMQVSLDRIVAIKILSKQYATNAPFIERFRREAMALARLSHPNVVAVYDVGESDGFHYFSMEYMVGGTIAQKISRGRKLPPETTVNMMIDVARGLEYAEKQGIVHRDIKPANMMLDRQDNVKIGDLGIARSIDESQADIGPVGVYGSPHYIAPEQGSGGIADHRSDIYSLGASFYRILTGKTLFRGSSARDVILKHLHEQATPLRELEPRLPNILCRAVEKMICKDPSDRYQNAGEVVEALEKVRHKMHAPLISKSNRSKLRASRSKSKRATNLAVAAVVTAVVMLAACLLYYIFGEQPQ